MPVPTLSPEPAEPFAPLVTLLAGTNPLTWHGLVEERLCAGFPGRQFLYGGFVIAACVDAAQRATGLAMAHAACQFRSMARPGEMLDFAVESHGGGDLRTIGVAVRANGRRIADMSGTVGTRDPAARDQVTPAPAARPPEECRPFSIARLMSSNLQALFECRLVDGALPDGPDWTCEPHPLCLFWARTRRAMPVDRPILAAMADFLAIAIPGVVCRPASATSLDNHVRFIGEAPEGWVLCRAAIDAIAAGLVHGRIELFSADGGLLAIGSQTMVLRG